MLYYFHFKELFMEKYNFSKLKKSTLVDVKDLYIGSYSFLDDNLSFVKYNKDLINFVTNEGVNRKINVTSLLVVCGGVFYDIMLRRNVVPDKVDYYKPLSKYTSITDGKMKVSTAKEVAVLYFEQFNIEHQDEPKWYEPKVLLKDTLPYLEIRNSFIESDKSAEKTIEKPTETKNHHSKFAPSSQGVKSRKSIEDDFELTV